jgi:hypothetical protein
MAQRLVRKFSDHQHPDEFNTNKPILLISMIGGTGILR